MRYKYDVQHVPASFIGVGFLNALSFPRESAEGNNNWSLRPYRFTNISWIKRWELLSGLTNSGTSVPLEGCEAVCKTSQVCKFLWKCISTSLTKPCWIIWQRWLTSLIRKKNHSWNVDPWRMGSVWENPALPNQPYSNLWKNCLWFQL